MSSEQEFLSGERTYVDDLRETFVRSTGLKVATVGVVLYLLGAGIRQGVWAAIFAMWGMALIGVGLLSYGIVWWRR